MIAVLFLAIAGGIVGMFATDRWNHRRQELAAARRRHPTAPPLHVHLIRPLELEEGE